MFVCFNSKAYHFVVWIIQDIDNSTCLYGYIVDILCLLESYWLLLLSLVSFCGFMNELPWKYLVSVFFLVIANHRIFTAQWFLGSQSVCKTLMYLIMIIHGPIPLFGFML